MCEEASIAHGIHGPATLEGARREIAIPSQGEISFKVSIPQADDSKTDGDEKTDGTAQKARNVEKISRSKVIKKIGKTKK